MKHIQKTVLILAVAMMFAAGVENSARAADDRPNIVWILSEDNSQHYLRLYGDKLGITPNIEKLASEGVTFNHAFSNAPVCSVARTTLMSGMLAPRVGFQYHRKSALAHLPGDSQLFPAYLRAAGYYTTNQSKKDYNVVEGKVWDESSRKASWKKRPTPETPFFHMQTTGLSHESSLHFKPAVMENEKTTTDTAAVEIAPYHPDTPTFRYTYARYHDRMMAIDKAVGQIVQQLDSAGVLDNTIIFYFGDHGGVLPRSKGYVYEAGLHVPLVVRVPEKWRAKLAVEPGTRADGFVSFIDFGPTVLNLASVDVPKAMDGKPFLGDGVDRNEVEKRDETYGYADRFDEKYDFVRSLRKGRFKYIRNYQSFYPDGLQNNYRYIMLAYAEWRELYKAGKLNEAQSAFFEPRPAEMLFDVEADPHEVNNLADNPAHRVKLLEMRELLRDRVKSLPDLSLYPESYLVDKALEDGVAFGQKHKEEIARLVDIADLSLLPAEDAIPKLNAAIKSDNAWDRYWTLTVCSCFGEEAQLLSQAATKCLSDDELLVRVRAAEFLALIGAVDPRPTLRQVLADSESSVEALITMNTIVFLRDHTDTPKLDPAGLKIKSSRGEVQRRVDYLTGKLKK